MGFEKRIASEGSSVLTNDEASLRQIFQRLGKRAASELEILRTARDLHLEISNLRDSCEKDANGLLILKFGVLRNVC